MKERDDLRILPFWRGIFGIFFIYGIMKIIRGDESANRLEQATFSAGGLAAGWIIIGIVGGGLGRTGDTGLDLLGTILPLLSVLCLVPVQNYINGVNAKLDPQPEHTPWSAGHIVCLVLGIMFWALVLAGLALPAQ